MIVRNCGLALCLVALSTGLTGGYGVWAKVAHPRHKLPSPRIAQVTEITQKPSAAAQALPQAAPPLSAPEDITLADVSMLSVLTDLCKAAKDGDDINKLE